MSARRALRIWNRRPAEAARLLEAAGEAALGGRELGLRSWLALNHERDQDRAERTARAALRRGGDTRFATATLAEILAGRGEHDAAVDALRAERARHPEIRWYALSEADALVEAGRVAEAQALLESVASDEELRRHCYKRLSQLSLEHGDLGDRLRWFGAHISLSPNYLVYVSDYAMLARLQLEAGDRDAARETLDEGQGIYARNAELRTLRSEHFEEPAESPAAPSIAPVSEAAVGAHRIPVRTPFITRRTGLLPLIDDATRGRREPADVLALAESAAAAGQGRLLPLELVDPSPMAKVLCRFVGKIGPLHSPPGMQGAIMEAGSARVAVAAVAGAVGKLAGRRGWFYRVAGPATAMIDDVAAAMPPHDHHMVFGPAEPDALAASLAADLGCAVAIVDANHLTGAWVVGASRGVDREWVTAALNDNPAGNEDEQTPVVLVRPLARAGAAA